MRRLLQILPLVVLGLLTLSANAWALPALKSGSDTVDDATITLRVLEQTIVDDVRSLCTLDIDIVGAAEPFTGGDTVELWVYEDDVVGDDLIWHHKFTVTAAEVAANHVTGNFDCSGNFEYDGFGGSLELYAEAEVVKDACGWTCTYDRPTTANIASLEVDDDNAEDDDLPTTAVVAGLGTTVNRINADQDWFKITTSAAARTIFEVSHYPSVGRIDAVMYDSNNTVVPVAVVSDEVDKTLIIADPVAAGTYTLKLSPRLSNDFNFYDMTFSLDLLSVECNVGAQESRLCGNCGEEVRTCLANFTWGLYGSCSNEGACTPDATEIATCETDGTWERTCDASCAWGVFSTCVHIGCTGAETQPCYTGTTATRTVGACTDGLQTCANNAWGACSGEVLPVAESCDDTIDNDCDNAIDDADDDCAVAGGALGDPCAADSACGNSWTCVMPPAHDIFAGGYCGRAAQCANTPGECTAGGLCADVGGSDFCLKRCTVAADCRQGYTCATLTGGKACVPKCLNDTHCNLVDKPTCDVASGLCTLGSAPEDTSTNTDTSANTDTSTNTDTSSQSDTSSTPDGSADAGADTREPGIVADPTCGCSLRRQTSPVSASLAIGLGLLALLVIRRRRS